jgi:hypothetical protein
MKNKKKLEKNLNQFGVWEDLQMIYLFFIFIFLLFFYCWAYFLSRTRSIHRLI